MIKLSTKYFQVSLFCFIMEEEATGNLTLQQSSLQRAVVVILLLLLVLPQTLATLALPPTQLSADLCVNLPRLPTFLTSQTQSDHQRKLHILSPSSIKYPDILFLSTTNSATNSAGWTFRTRSPLRSNPRNKPTKRHHTSKVPKYQH